MELNKEVVTVILAVVFVLLFVYFILTSGADIMYCGDAADGCKYGCDRDQECMDECREMYWRCVEDDGNLIEFYPVGETCGVGDDCSLMDV